MASRARFGVRRWGRLALSVALAGVALTLVGAPAASATSARPGPFTTPVVSTDFGRDGDGARGHGFVRDERSYRRVDAPNASLTAALGRNNRGQVVGAFADERDRFHGFVQRGDRVEPIDVPGARGTVASKINDQGQIVGFYTDRSRTPAFLADRGFLFDGSRFRRIDLPEARATRPYGINNLGQITGEYVDRAGMSTRLRPRPRRGRDHLRRPGRGGHAARRHRRPGQDRRHLLRPRHPTCPRLPAGH